MNEYLLKLIQKYKNKGLLIDTNIVLLYIVGSIDILLIRDFPRTSMFTEDDFDKVSRFIDYFDFKITTPHVLTEISNLIGNRQNIQSVLKTYIEKSREIFLESSGVSNSNAFLNFGLADTAIMDTAKNSYLIFTNDRPFYGFLINSQIDAVNLDQLREI
jgi:hypothetical protein